MSCDVITYRHFRNGDPPQLLSLWHSCGLGRGAAFGITCDALDLLVYSVQYFDPRGLFVALDGNRAVGFVHAGFGSNDSGSGISPQSGVICVIMVHPDYRRQGIGRRLVELAEDYLRAAGTVQAQAGSISPRDPFYQLLYGGVEASGFLESDPLADPFFKALGYEPRERRFVYHRDLKSTSDPVDFRVIGNRRALQLQITDQARTLAPWWVTRLGQLETIRFQETPRRTGPVVAELTCVGLETYTHTWKVRAAGLFDLFVPSELRRKGYAKTLLLDVCKRLRDEQVDLVEMQVSETNPAGMGLLKSAGFKLVDTGVAYGKTLL
jgi:ribosomal protein S18 acetylase RimI-like enzyme